MVVKSRVPVVKETGPSLGLVCVSLSEEIRYKTITRSRYSKFGAAEQNRILWEVYSNNVEMFKKALSFCHDRGIRLYRMPSSIFPFADTQQGMKVLKKFKTDLEQIGVLAEELDIRIVAHPDQFVVLSSDSQKVIENSVVVLQMHADIFDLIGLSRTQYNAIIIHGGKRGNEKILKRSIGELSESIRSRLTLENDETSYSSNTIFSICRETGLSMIFDAHHHLIKEKCRDYEDARIGEALQAARTTWHPHEDWQLVHISNGTNGIHDRRHSDFIDVLPECYGGVGWIEVEARAKEAAIERIRSFWPPARRVEAQQR